MEDWQRVLVEKGVLCPIHLDWFDDPRILVPCGHTLCASCLERWREAHPILLCPLCKQPVTSDTPNLALRDVSEHLAGVGMEQERVRQHGPVCGSCEEGQVATKFCVSCDVLWCDPCFDKLHAPVPPFKQHRVVAAAQRGVEQFAACVEATHSGELRKFWCSPCGSLMCIHCTMDSAHKGHTVIPLEQAGQEAREEMRKGLEESVSVEAGLDEVEKRLLQLIEVHRLRHRELREEIEACAAEQHKAVDQLKDVLLKELGDRLEGEVTLESTLGSVRSCRQGLGGVAHVARGVLEGGTARVDQVVTTSKKLVGFLRSNTLAQASRIPADPRMVLFRNGPVLELEPPKKSPRLPLGHSPPSPTGRGRGLGSPRSPASPPYPSYGGIY